MQQKPVNTLSPNNVRAQGATHAAAARRMAVELSTHAARTLPRPRDAQDIIIAPRSRLTSHGSRPEAQTKGRNARTALSLSGKRWPRLPPPAPAAPPPAGERHAR